MIQNVNKFSVTSTKQIVAMTQMEKKRMAAILRALREKRGASLYSVVQSTGMSYDQLKGLESGKLAITWDSLCKYMLALGIRADFSLIE